MRERAQKPFGLGGDIGLTVSNPAASNTGNGNSDVGWRTSGGRNRPRSALPRLSQVLAAVIIVAAMSVLLHFFFN